MKGFSDLLKQKPSWLFMLFGWRSVSVAFLVIQCKKPRKCGCTRGKRSHSSQGVYRFLPDAICKKESKYIHYCINSTQHRFIEGIEDCKTYVTHWPSVNTNNRISVFCALRSHPRHGMNSFCYKSFRMWKLERNTNYKNQLQCSWKYMDRFYMLI
jgi:hypothetical protein